MKDVIERGLVFIGGFRSVQEISGRYQVLKKRVAMKRPLSSLSCYLLAECLQATAILVM